MRSPRFHNHELESLQVPVDFGPAHADAVARALESHGTLTLVPLATGLYPASSAAASVVSGYRSVWVRDNVFVALALLESGHADRAATIGARLAEFYLASRHRFDAVILGQQDRHDVRGRPHVRFDGETLREIDGPWAHAQNDALGYCLWLLARLTRSGLLSHDGPHMEVIELITRFLAAIAYWQDEDSGHWEETRKISASSIGVVTAGLREVAALLQSHSSGAGSPSYCQLASLAGTLIDEGRRTLAAILPGECAQLTPLQNRRYDAALTCLVYPLDVLEPDMAAVVVEDVRRYLMGPIGVRRYLRDSYWAPDYDRLSEYDRTRDYSNDLPVRDAMLEDVGLEAQWCLFDPLLSAHFGVRFAATRDQSDRQRQAFHFNRTLAQITDDWRCPELYYVKEGSWVPNPHTPLLWTQANVLLALAALRRTAQA